jgi:DNA-binding CsgD family transcriptional regulator
VTLRRVEIPPLRLCRIPQCPNELDVKAPARGPKANMCEDCRKGEGSPIRFYLENRARGGVTAGSSVRTHDRLRRPPGPPTEIELGILKAVARGRTNDEIAAETFRSPETIKSQLKSLLAKLEARNRPHLVAIGYERGLLP